MYIDFNENLFTFNKIEEEEKLVGVDLDNQEYIGMGSGVGMNDDEENLNVSDEV